MKENPSTPRRVHASVDVEDGVEIGEGTQVWHHCHIMAGASIGQRCILGQNVFVDRGVQIGNDVKVQNNVSVYRCVTLEDEVFVGPSAVFTNVKRPRSAHPRDLSEYDEILVRRGATIGANATIVCGVTIGEYAFVGAGAVVTKDVPAHAVVLGSPAAWRGWACICGLTVDVYPLASRMSELVGRPKCFPCPSCGWSPE